MSKEPFELAEVIVSTLSLICCTLMIIIYSKNEQMKNFSYAIQFYIVLGATLFSFFDCVYNWVVILSQDENNFICQIVAYISVYGIMNSVTWTTALIYIAKSAITERTQEQLAKHLTTIAITFIIPILTTILPQLANIEIYGLHGDVCWFAYTSEIIQSAQISSKANSSLEMTIVTILFFFFPVILQCISQLYLYRIIQKKIHQQRINKTLYKGHESHIKAINSLQYYPTFYLIVWSVPCLIYLLLLGEVEIQSTLPFEIFRIIQSTIGIVYLLIYTQNKQSLTALNDLFSNRNPSLYEIRIDLFQGLEEFQQFDKQ